MAATDGGFHPRRWSCSAGSAGSVQPSMSTGCTPGSRAAGRTHGTYRESAPDTPAFAVERTRYISCTDKPPGDPMLMLAAAQRRTGMLVDELSAGRFAALTVPDELAVRLLAAGGGMTGRRGST